jgi:hypothetical protein
MLRLLRWTCTPIIAVREAMKLAQIGARSVPWRSIDAHSKREMTAIALQLDGHWEASNFDPFERRVRAVALAPLELVGVAETARARVGF